MSNPQVQAVLNRLSEPSTYAGLSALLIAAGQTGIGGADWNTVFNFVAMAAGFLAAALKDPGAVDKVPTHTRG